MQYTLLFSWVCKEFWKFCNLVVRFGVLLYVNAVYMCYKWFGLFVM